MYHRSTALCAVPCYSPYGMPTAAEAESFAILDAYIDAGGNFIDTADSYNESEELIGKWLAKLTASDPAFRSRIVLATKVFIQQDPTDPNRGFLSRKHIYKWI